MLKLITFWRRFAPLFLGFTLLTATLVGQGTAPSRTPPPPPPNFTPPSLPPNLQAPPFSADPEEEEEAAMPPAASPVRPSAAPRRPTTFGTPRPPPPEPGSDEAEEAFMNEQVGLIRLPDLGTNEVLEMLESFTRKPILRQQSLPAVKITFFSQGALTRREAIMAIESLLALNGIAITEVGEKFLKAVPVAAVVQQVPIVWEGSTLDAVPNQRIYEKVFALDFLTGEEAVPIIQPLLSQGAPLVFTKNNFILVTDALINLQRVEQLFLKIDRPPSITQEVLFYQLDHIDASEALSRLQRLAEGPLSRQLQNNTTFDADERTNQLMVFTHPANKDLVDDLVEKLDIDVAPLTDTKVFDIRYAEATEVVSILESVITGQKQARDNRQNQSNDAAQAAAQRRAQVEQQRANQAAAAARQEAGGSLQFSDLVTLVPDERANTIVASGTTSDLESLTRLINEIDVLLAQVRIEVIIAEVRLGENDARGIDSLGFRYNTEGVGSGVNLEDDIGFDQRSLDGGTGASGGRSPLGLYGLSIPTLTWGPGGFGIEAALGTIAGNENASVLSAPTIVTTHNKEAKVTVGQQQPVLIGTTSSGTTSVVTNNIQFIDVNLELTVTPLIGADGVIQMEVEQSVQSILGQARINEAGEQRPIIGNRSANSYISVRDGEVVILGGLQRLDTFYNENRMAILGKLPMIGDLFTSETEKSERTELLIFLRPSILRTTEEVNADAVRMIGQLEDGPVIQNYLDTGTFNEQLDEDADEEARELPRRFKP